MARKAGSLADVPDEFMQCRAFRKHAEFQVTERVVWKGTGRNRRPIQMIREEICPNCGRALEVVYLLPGFERMSVRTYYPDDYLVEGGVSAIESKQEYLDRMAEILPVEPEEREDRRRKNKPVSTGKKSKRGKK